MDLSGGRTPPGPPDSSLFFARGHRCLFPTSCVSAHLSVGSDSEERENKRGEREREGGRSTLEIAFSQRAAKVFFGQAGAIIQERILRATISRGGQPCPAACHFQNPTYRSIAYTCVTPASRSSLSSLPAYFAFSAIVAFRSVLSFAFPASLCARAPSLLPFLMSHDCS